MTKVTLETIAQRFSAEKDLPYGLCVHDGKFYIGTTSELSAIGVVIHHEQIESPK